jgi:hypothetical protein
MWEELKPSGDHHTRVIHWLETKTTDKRAKGSEGVAKRLQAWKVQDTCRISKNAAMQRHIKK